LKLFSAPYHAAIKRSLNAFPTSPLESLYAESGLPSVIARVEELTFQLIPKLLNTTNKILFQNVVRAYNHKRTYRLQSTLRRCAQYCKSLALVPPTVCNKTQQQPPWMLKKESICTALEPYSKNSTSAEFYQRLFAEITDSIDIRDRKKIFTDGSKSESSTTFAVVHEDGTLISRGMIGNDCSVFTAEALAIKEAVSYAIKEKGKFLICSDSKSSVKAVENIQNNDRIVSFIRDACIRYPKKIKILWIPGHSGIKGNELADLAANDAHRVPCCLHPTFNKNDINKIIKCYLQNNRKHRIVLNKPRQKLIFKSVTGTKYPKVATRPQTTIFTQLRIGHTRRTHGHILEGKTAPNPCQFCGQPAEVDHFLVRCSHFSNIRSKYFNNSNILEILAVPSIQNVKNIFNYVNECNFFFP